MCLLTFATTGGERQSTMPAGGLQERSGDSPFRPEAGTAGQGPANQELRRERQGVEGQVAISAGSVTHGGKHERLH